MNLATANMIYCKYIDIFIYLLIYVLKYIELHTVEPRFHDNAINGNPPLVYNKLRSQIFLAFCNAKLPLDNGHAFSGESPISVKYFVPK